MDDWLLSKEKEDVEKMYGYIARFLKVWVGQWEYRCNQINKVLEYIR